jgi:uncharacterized protein (TIGR00106 family)
MLVEFSLLPLLGNNSHLSAELAKALQLIHASGLPYELTPSGTCVEGEWDQVLPLIRQCHERARKTSPHVITIIKIEDEEGERHKLTRNVTSLEEKVGHPLRRTE